MENKIIEFENKHIRILSNDNWTTVWFVAQDLEQITDHKHIVNTINKVLDQDEYDTVVLVDSTGKKNQCKIVNESGFYHLLFKSKLEKAILFRKKVTGEILPEIRRTGSYGNKEQTNFINKLATNEAEINSLVVQKKALNKRLLFLRLENENVKDTLFKSVNIPSIQSTQLELF